MHRGRPLDTTVQPLPGLSVVEPSSLVAVVAQVQVQERLQALMSRAGQKRSVGATAANEHSSRSHMVFMLTIIGHRASTGQSVHGALEL